LVGSLHYRLSDAFRANLASGVIIEHERIGEKVLDRNLVWVS
jgi:hypothetical protein